MLFVHALLKTVVSIQSLRLFANNVGSKTGKTVEAELYWDHVEKADFYVIFKRNGGAEWQSISTFDFNDDKPVRILNAYPLMSDCNYNATVKLWWPFDANFVFKTGEMLTTSKSASLKVWLEGGYINGEQFENVGRNVVHPTKQSIEVAYSLSSMSTRIPS